MYKLVETEQDKRTFRRIYEEICRTESFEIEGSSEKAIQYLIYYGEKPVGTVEFSPYEPNGFSTVKDFDFMQIDVIRDHQGAVWEIDKLGLLEDYRKMGLLNEILEVLYVFHKKNPVDYSICLFEYRFYRLIKRMAPQHVTAVAEAFLVKGEKSKIVPSIVDGKSCVNWYEENVLVHKTVNV